jgi:hypothetical protein
VALHRSFDIVEGGKQMKLRMMIVTGLAIFSLGLLPAAGMADGPTYTPGGPNGKAYGYYCRGESKKHVKGVKGTAFSNCVKAMAQADKNDSMTARKACKSLSKKHVKGVKGTPFSTCIKGVNQMRREQNATVATSSAV